MFFAPDFYPDEWTWLENDPVQIARDYNPASSPAIYLSCGVKDTWGCMEGSQAIVDIVKAKGGQIAWYSRPGGHCDIDVESLAEFLMIEEKNR